MNDIKVKLSQAELIMDVSFTQDPLNVGEDVSGDELYFEGDYDEDDENGNDCSSYVNFETFFGVFESSKFFLLSF